ncbi:Golgi-associated plant pathogenesis-related protein 1, partial [Orchesella cincta]
YACSNITDVRGKTRKRQLPQQQPGPTNQQKQPRPTNQQKQPRPTNQQKKLPNISAKDCKEDNDIRVKHAAPKLAIDENLSEKATNVQNTTQTLEELTIPVPTKEMLEKTCGCKQGTWTKDEVSKVATESWYDEGKNYDFTKTVPQANTASFTQLVWKKSNKMGFGVAQKNGFSAATALFAPPGNVEGQFADNVKPNKKAKTPAPKPTDAPAAQPAATDPPANSQPAATDPPANSPPAATDPPADPQLRVTFRQRSSWKFQRVGWKPRKRGGPRGGKGR